jgi:hypothetical protein
MSARFLIGNLGHKFRFVESSIFPWGSKITQILASAHVLTFHLDESAALLTANGQTVKVGICPREPNLSENEMTTSHDSVSLYLSGNTLKYSESVLNDIFISDSWPIAN